MVPILGHPHGLHYMERTGPTVPPNFIRGPPEGHFVEPWDAHASADDPLDLPPGFAQEEEEPWDDAHSPVEEDEPWEDTHSSVEEDAQHGGATGSTPDLPPGFNREPDDWSAGGIA